MPYIDPKTVGAFSWRYRLMLKVRRYARRALVVAAILYFAIAAYGRYHGATP